MALSVSAFGWLASLNEVMISLRALNGQALSSGLGASTRATIAHRPSSRLPDATKMMGFISDFGCSGNAVLASVWAWSSCEGSWLLGYIDRMVVVATGQG